MKYKDVVKDGKADRFYETYVEDNPSSRDYGEIMIKEEEPSYHKW